MPKIKSSKDINTFIQDFLDNCTLKGLAPKTTKSYHQCLTLFTKYLEDENK